MSRVCGIDLGTQSCRVIIYDAQERKTLAAASAPLELRAGDDGSREQEAQWYQAALDQCFSTLDPALRASVQAVGVSGQQHGFVPLDATGQAHLRR
jgi:xylulokinase